MAVSGSVLTVIRSLDAIAKGAKFLQDIPEIQTEFLELRKEIAFIEDLARGAQSVGGNTFSTTPQVVIAIQRLREISEHLQAIEQYCAKSDGHITKVKKGKWLAKSNKVQGLLQKAQEAKSNLSHALLLQERQQNNIMAIQISQLYQILVAAGQGSPALSSHTLRETSVSNLRMIEGPVGLVAPTREIYNPNPDDQDDFQDIQRQDVTSSPDLVQLPSSKVMYDLMKSRKLVSYEKTECLNDCRCRCHLKPRSFKNPGWLHPIFGSLSIKYHPAEEQDNLQWDYRCACSKEGSISVDFKPPSWLRGKIMFSQASYPLRCALRPVRTLSFSHHAWHDVGLPVEELQILITEGRFYFPDDELSGVNLVEHMIILRQYEALEFLLAVWRDMLQTTGLARRVWYTLNIARGIHTQLVLSDVEARVLKLVELYIEDKPESTYSRLHGAVYSGNDFSQILQEEPDTLDELDGSGYSALHSAVEKGNTGPLQQLLDAGADINRKSRHGLTPLALAARENKVECMRTLLQAGCRINDRDEEGSTALHCAVEMGSLEAVRLLLQEGASASIRSDEGFSLLHALAIFYIGDREALAKAEGLVDLLLGVDSSSLNAKNSMGRTPLAHAITKSNGPLVRLLIESGASYNELDRDSANLLHVAARWGRSECLTFLAELDLGGIDTSLRDAGGRTPWDHFVHCLLAAERYRYARRPEAADAAAFAELYQGIRDRNLEHEIAVLTRALDELSTGGGGVRACKLLDGLREWKSEHHNGRVASWYRALSGQIKHGGRQEAVVEIEECLDDLRTEMATSPWAQPNVYNFIFTDETIRHWTGMAAVDADADTLSSTASDTACEEQTPVNKGDNASVKEARFIAHDADHDSDAGSKHK